jgi:hypothetical protein
VSLFVADGPVTEPIEAALILCRRGARYASGPARLTGSATTSGGRRWRRGGRVPFIVEPAARPMPAPSG